jgi:hypothetical protein
MQKKTSEHIDTQTDAEPIETTVRSEEVLADSNPDTTSKEIQEQPSQPAKPQKRRLLARFRTKKWLAIFLAVLLIVAILGVVPFTRYKILGLFVKEPLTITVFDSTTHAPITGAIVRVNTTTATTNASGQATVTVPVGDTTASISKQYYKSASSYTLVTLTPSQNTLNLNLVATGRQVPILVMNKINNQPVANATIKVLDTVAQTDKNGKATIVLPTTTATQGAAISATGYNTLQVSVTVTSQVVATNTFTIVPAGKVYFLSNLSGKIDVVSTNLDGSSRTTVVAGTGSETPDSTALLAARDWKYLALQSKRDTSTQSKIYLITTSTHNLSVIDEGTNVSFNFIGWDGDNFVYTVDRQKAINGTYDQTVLKSFNASTGHITTIDQTDTQASGSYGTTPLTTIQASLVSDGILYTKSWSSNGYYANASTDLPGKSQIIVKTKPDGSGAQTLKTINATDYQSIQQQVGGPNEVYYQLSGYGAGAKPPIYLKYESGSIQPTAEVGDNTFYSNTYATYLLSPSGSSTFWSVPTDGKSNLFVGDQDGNNATSVAKLSGYNTYGWYSDAYVLVSKSGSELYILPANGGNALKISDYYKPSQYFRGYGGGYGGI